MRYARPLNAHIRTSADGENIRYWWYMLYVPMACTCNSMIIRTDLLLHIFARHSHLFPCATMQEVYSRLIEVERQLSEDNSAIKQLQQGVEAHTNELRKVQSALLRKASMEDAAQLEQTLQHTVDKTEHLTSLVEELRSNHSQTTRDLQHGIDTLQQSFAAVDIAGLTPAVLELHKALDGLQEYVAASTTQLNADIDHSLSMAGAAQDTCRSGRYPDLPPPLSMNIRESYLY